jgi:hypothetical protein
LGVFTDSFLHALVATLSTGPVGFSDALGYNNATLIKATCDGGGQILKPTLPLAAIDRSFSVASTVVNTSAGSVGGAGAALAPQGVPQGGHVWATHTFVGLDGSRGPGSSGGERGVTWYMVLAITVRSSFSLCRADLWPRLAAAQAVVVWKHTDPLGSARLVRANESVLAPLQTGRGPQGQDSQGRATAGGPFATPTPLPVPPASPAVPPAPLDFEYVLVAPVMPQLGGWALLGEVGKLTPVAEQRRWRFESGRSAGSSSSNSASASHGLGGGFTVRMSGAAGERVEVAAWRAGEVRSLSAVLNADGEGVLFFS